MLVSAVSEQLHVKTLEQTETMKQTFVLRPDQQNIYTDFTAGRTFGDIQVAASPDGRSALRETHMGETEWSGIQLPGGHTCGVRIAGRVSFGSNVPGGGGYGFGLAERDWASGVGDAHRLSGPV